MRILVIAPEQLPVPPIIGGSVESCTYNLFTRMAEKDQVLILSRSNPSLPSVSRLVRDNLEIVRIPQRKRLSYIRAALDQVKDQRFDIIQIENRPIFVPYVRKVFPETPIILSLHSLTFMSFMSPNRADKILKQIDGVTSVVSFVSKTMKKRYPKHAHKFQTAVLGVNTDHFQPYSQDEKEQIRKRWKVASTFNVLFVGRIIPMKGLHTLVRSVARLKRRYPEIALIAVGASWPGVKRQTPYMRKVRLLSKRLGVPIRFTGYIPPADVNQMYHLGDIFVCPTQFREGFATVISEAMASGIPVVASKRGGISEVITDGQSGLLVNKYKSSVAFARAIARIKKSSVLSKQLSEGGRHRAISDLSWYSTVAKLRAHYHSVFLVT